MALKEVAISGIEFMHQRMPMSIPEIESSHGVVIIKDGKLVTDDISIENRIKIENLTPQPIALTMPEYNEPFYKPTCSPREYGMSKRKKKYK